MWRASENDPGAYRERAWKETQDRIAAGTMEAEPGAGGD
jgi:hypothetical protein